MASLRNVPQYLPHLQRKWISVTQDQDKPLVSVEKWISGILEQLQQTRRSLGGDAPGGHQPGHTQGRDDPISAKRHMGRWESL